MSYLNYWDAVVVLNDEHVTRFQEFKTEIMQDLHKDELKDNWLYAAREEYYDTRWSSWSRPGQERDPKEELIELTETIHSNDVEKWLSFFFPDLDCWRYDKDKKEHLIGLEDAGDHEYGYGGQETLTRFLGMICKPMRTHIEMQFMEDDGMPYRDVFIGPSPTDWKDHHPTLVWNYNNGEKND